MYTVCPTCSQALAVTAADLRVARGHVRCGRCHHVFNALDYLSDEPPQPPGRESAPAAPEERMRDADRSPADVPAESSAEPPAVASWPSRTPTEDSGRDAAGVDIVEPDDLIEPLEPADSLETLERAAPAAPAGSAGPAEQTSPRPALEDPEPGAQAPEDEFALDPEPPHASTGWTVGVVLLVALLALQVVNHYRDVLVTYPALTGPLRTAYGVLGIELAPHWDVRAYEARQLGATVSGTNTREITVRASIANRAPRPQPLPLLRVTLQDRFGRPIAARDVPPRDYLPSVPSPALLPPGGRVDARVVFVSPGAQTFGFEIDACLPEDGSVICAHGR